MNGNRASHTASSLLRAAVPSVVAFLGLTAVIVGILAMHVWMGGHGSTSHHVGAPVTSTTTSTHSVDGTGQGRTILHDRTTTAVIAAMATVETTVLDAASHAASTTVTKAVPDGGGSVGCGGDCADEMMVGLCVLAMIVVGIAGLLTPAGRALLSAVGRRGPPALSRMSRPAPTPSLTQLCISRT
ncbi:hypothetical protein IWX63_000646 [Arthrobacter sp. CAN_A2]|uniref:hypothetical protein n=1 Tax=Arthrobacter sp. CAN_A2 TaxID=2787718 RepID=UPI0018EFE62F